MDYSFLRATDHSLSVTNFSQLNEDIYCKNCDNIYKQSADGKTLTCAKCSIVKQRSNHSTKPIGFSSVIRVDHIIELYTKQLINFDDMDMLQPVNFICPDCKTRSFKKYCMADSSKQSLGKNFIVCMRCLREAMSQKPINK